MIIKPLIFVRNFIFPWNIVICFAYWKLWRVLIYFIYFSILFAFSRFLCFYIYYKCIKIRSIMTMYQRYPDDRIQISLSHFPLLLTSLLVTWPGNVTCLYTTIRDTERLVTVEIYTVISIQSEDSLLITFTTVANFTWRTSSRPEILNTIKLLDRAWDYRDSTTGTSWTVDTYKRLTR